MIIVKQEKTFPRAGRRVLVADVVDYSELALVLKQKFAVLDVALCLIPLGLGGRSRMIVRVLLLDWVLTGMVDRLRLPTSCRDLSLLGSGLNHRTDKQGPP